MLKKVTGSDCVFAFFLKAVACEIDEPLALIFNKSLDTGLVPSAWKYCNVTPIYKGGDKDDPGNFRPISVVPVVAKILEKLIASRLGMYLESHNFLREHQSVYRHGKLSEQLLLFAVDSIVRALDQGFVVCAAFLDPRKAFDSLDHVILLERFQQLGVCGTGLRWFQNYLSDHFQQVKCGTVFSDWKLVKGGIPQGNALGPLLFLIYVNNIPKQVQHGP